MFRRAVDAGLVSANPAALLTYPRRVCSRIIGERDDLVPEEVAHVLDTAE